MLTKTGVRLEADLLGAASRTKKSHGKRGVGVCEGRPPRLLVAGTGARAQSYAVIRSLVVPCWGCTFGRLLGKSVCRFLMKLWKHFL